MPETFEGQTVIKRELLPDGRHEADPQGPRHRRLHGPRRRRRLRPMLEGSGRQARVAQRSSTCAGRSRGRRRTRRRRSRTRAAALDVEEAAARHVAVEERQEARAAETEDDVAGVVDRDLGRPRRVARHAGARVEIGRRSTTGPFRFSRNVPSWRLNRIEFALNRSIRGGRGSHKPRRRGSRRRTAAGTPWWAGPR